MIKLICLLAHLMPFAQLKAGKMKWKNRLGNFFRRRMQFNENRRDVRFIGNY